MSKKNHSNDEAELVQVLDEAKCAITNTKLKAKLGWNDSRYDEAKKSLLRAQAIYATQEGIILHGYATIEQQIWHLGWCLGLFETAGLHVTMDTQLLLDAPRIVKELIAEGKFDDNKRKKGEKLRELQHRVVATMELPKKLLGVYNQVLQIVDDELKLAEGVKQLQEKYPRK